MQADSKTQSLNSRLFLEVLFMPIFGCVFFILKLDKINGVLGRFNRRIYSVALVILAVYVVLRIDFLNNIYNSIVKLFHHNNLTDSKTLKCVSKRLLIFDITFSWDWWQALVSTFLFYINFI